MTQTEFADVIQNVYVLRRRIQYHLAIAKIASQAYTLDGENPWKQRRDHHVSAAERYHDLLLTAEEALLDAGERIEPDLADMPDGEIQ